MAFNSYFYIYFLYNYILIHFRLQRCVRLQMLPSTLPLSFLVLLLVYICYRHSFSSLIDKQLSRKATLMFQDVLLFELFQLTLPNPFLFSLKSTQKFSRQNLQIRKKAYCPGTAPGTTSYPVYFSYVSMREYPGYETSQQPIQTSQPIWTSQQPISLRHDLKTSSAL